jgi:prepilin-type N-terminal cleavage/methylation domain-containing protein
MSARRTDEHGFTLIELMIAIVLLTLVAVAITGAFVTAMTSTRTTVRLGHDANDAQLMAALLVRDAQAAGGFNPTSSPDSTLGVYVPASGSTCGTGTQGVVGFKWIDNVNVSVAHTDVANYWYSNNTVVRAFCADGGTPTTLVVATHVAASPAPVCVTGCSGIPPLVMVTVTEGSPSTYSFNLSAAVRPQTYSAPAGGPAAESSPLIALGSSCPDITLDGNANLAVSGDVVMNSTSSSCFSKAGAAQFSSDGNIFTRIGDPFAGLQPPANCSGPQTGTTYNMGAVTHYTSGVWQSNPNPSNQTSVFDPGSYTFCSGLTLGANVNASSGAGGVLFYIAGGTLSVTANAIVQLSAMTTGPYANLLIWDQVGTPPSPPQSLSFDGGASANSYNGVIYMPHTNLTITGNNAVSYGGIVALSVTFTGTGKVSLGPLRITSLNPASLAQGATNQTITVTGTGFQSGAVVTIPCSGIIVNSTTFNSSTTLTINVSILSGAALGPCKVTVNNPSGATFTLNNGFTVTAGPGITSVAPSTFDEGGSQTITITGSNFTSAVTVGFSGAGVTASGPATVNGAGTQITQLITVAASPAALGAHNVIVTNSNGAVVTATGALTVQAPPTITSVTSAVHSSTTNITISGSGFLSGASVSISGTGNQKVTVNSVTVNSSTSITVNVKTPSGTGSHNVTVTNFDGVAVTKNNVFTVT